MSRLDSFIRRMQAQRSCLALALKMIEDVEGAIFELWLGNGRTFDHLKENLPGRDIFAFDMAVNAHPDSMPDDAHLFLGDFLDRLPALEACFAGQVALVHADFGSPQEPGRSETVVTGLNRVLPPFLAAGGVILSDSKLHVAGTDSVSTPADVATGRYFMCSKPR
jgi:hypothetical protein